MIKNISKCHISRRELFAYGAAATVGSAVSSLSAIPNDGFLGAPYQQHTPASIHAYSNYAWLRGFNVIASWGARIEQAWWEYNPDRFREEVNLAAQVHSNCIRLWIEYTAWMADPDKITAFFMDAVKAIDEAGMKTMPCLFNRWHDLRWDYGGTYLENLHGNYEANFEYLKAIAFPLAKDPRILVWDLCNEPSASSINDPSQKREFEWLQSLATKIKEFGVQQPVTIGTRHSVGSMSLYATLCDVITCHPYAHTPEQMKVMHEECKTVQQKYNKPMLCNECIPGSIDDLRRAECARFNIEGLESAGWGWMGWGMREGKAVSTRRDRMDANGLDGKGFHAWFTADGKLRDGLDFLKEKPKILPPWQS